MKSFYEILKSTPTASFEELRRNYKQLILRCHPDKLQHIENTNTTTTDTANINGDNATAITNNAATITPNTVDLHAEISISTASDQNSEEFVAINEAWNTLKDPIKRRHYDAELLLRKFQTHSNIFARLTLEDMKRCAVTATTKSGSGSDSDSEVVCVDEIEGKSAAGDIYYYIYDCRCGGQYIVDESVDSEILNRNHKRTKNVHSASRTSEEQKALQEKLYNHDKNVQAAAGIGAENAFTSICGNNNKSGGARVYEYIQSTATTDCNGDAAADAAADGDGEVLVECSECSLVIVLT